MKNKIIFLVVGVFFTSATAFAFSDLKSDHIYNEAINFIKENDIVHGYPDGTFKPDNQINRAELLKIIIESKFSDSEIQNALNEYRANNYTYVDLYDVSINEWFAPYVRIAVREGIVQGYPDGNFKPAQNVNFVEALKIVLKTYNISYNENTDPWYSGSVEKASGLNLIPLDITSFDLNITRAQMADLITRVLKYQEGILNDYLKHSYPIKQSFNDILSGNDKIYYFANRSEPIGYYDIINNTDLSGNKAVVFSRNIGLAESFSDESRIDLYSFILEPSTTGMEKISQMEFDIEITGNLNVEKYILYRSSVTGPIKESETSVIIFDQPLSTGQSDIWTLKAEINYEAGEEDISITTSLKNIGFREGIAVVPDYEIIPSHTITKVDN